jgi:hypothetical protein
MGSKKRVRWAGRGLAALAALFAVVSSGAGCESNNLVEDPCASNIKSYDAFTPASDDIKLDLLFTIDNSRSMADKQALLALAVPDLVEALVNPPCVDEAGVPAPKQPKGPLELCPTPGTRRSQRPIFDMHIGVISSSLGGHGSDACPDLETSSCSSGLPNLSNNDRGRLLTRKDPCLTGDVASYQNKGFLAWDPAGLLEPSGEKDMTALSGALRDMVTGAGQIGCGYEAQLESWYRFLVDPEPYASLSTLEGKATPEGIDTVLLTQRADFLRPDSMLMIVLLSDENDCSIKEHGQFYFAAKQKNPNGAAFHLPRPRSECAVNPNDPCCKSCGQDPGNCPVDPTCFDASDNVKVLTDIEDNTNLRCFDQKRRFGIDFLYPIERYTTALQSVTVPNRAGDLVPNPLFSDLNPSDANSFVRSPGQIFLVGVVGVPWQDIARDPTDLAKGFKDAYELLNKDENGMNAWDLILGEPSQYVPPKDPHMIESIEPRSGSNPVTGDGIGPVGSPTPSSINGGEWTIKDRDDLQYACAFLLDAPRDCSDPANVACDCKDPANDNPLCAEDPSKPGSRTLQVKAKAYPSVRELEVLRGMGAQAITASVCPANVTSPGQPEFAYRPVVSAILERLQDFVGHSSCIQQALPIEESGRLACRLIEARAVPDDSCSCDASRARSAIPAGDSSLVTGIKADPGAEPLGLNCFCELEQVANTDAQGGSTGALNACQQQIADFPVDASGEIVNGWCYVDATTTPSTGNPELVKACPDTAKRTLRFLGKGAPEDGARLYLTCVETCQ